MPGVVGENTNNGGGYFELENLFLGEDKKIAGVYPVLLVKTPTTAAGS